MNQNYESIVTMVKEFGKAITRKIALAPFDKTYEGTILKVLPSNTYLVLVNGKEYRITTKNNTYFKECQRIHVQIPQNNWKKIRILEDINAGDTVAKSVVSVNGKSGDVIIGIDDIKNLPERIFNLTPQCLRYTKIATENEVVEISIPDVSSTTYIINVLVDKHATLEHAIYGIDYAYRFLDDTTLQFDFLSSGQYIIDYIYSKQTIVTNIIL